MTHSATLLQARIVAALNEDAPLTALIGTNAVFDSPPKAKQGPYVIISRHDILARDADSAPGNDHRLMFDVWIPGPDRAAALAIAERLSAVLLDASMSDSELLVTHSRHVRTDTRIDGKSGHARAAVQWQCFSEPAG